MSRALRIGIDGTCLGSGRGYGRYLRELLPPLLAVGHQHEFVIVLDRETAAKAGSLPTRTLEPTTRVSLGIECKYQGGKGSAEEKIPATLEDIKAWPIKGIVVYSGDGFSENMRSYLISTGMAVEMDDLTKWLELYFGL